MYVGYWIQNECQMSGCYEAVEIEMDVLDLGKPLPYDKIAYQLERKGWSYSERLRGDVCPKHKETP